MSFKCSMEYGCPGEKYFLIVLILLLQLLTSHATSIASEDISLNSILNISSFVGSLSSFVRTRESNLYEAFVSKSNQSSFVYYFDSAHSIQKTSFVSVEYVGIVQFNIINDQSFQHQDVLVITTTTYSKELVATKMKEINQHDDDLKFFHFAVNVYDVTSLKYFLLYLTSHSVRIVLLLLNEEETSLLLEMTKSLTFRPSIWFTYFSTKGNFEHHELIKLVNIYEPFAAPSLPVQSSDIVLNSTASCLIDNNQDETYTMQYSQKLKSVWKIAAIFEKPFMIETPKANENDLCRANSVPCLLTVTELETCCSGIALEIFQLVADDLGVEFDLYIVEDGYYGNIDDNGTWNGIINDVMQGKADVGIQGITITEARSEVVDFTEHILESSLAITIRQSMLSVETVTLHWKFANAFQLHLSAAFLSSFFLLTIIIYLIESFARHLSGQKCYLFKEAFSYVSSLTFQRDLGAENPRKWSARIIALVHAGAMMIIMTTYTAVLTANHVVQNYHTFEGLRDPLITDPKSNFLLGIKRGTSIEQLLKTSEILHVAIGRTKWLDALDEGFQHVYSKSIDGFVSDYVYSLYNIMADPRYCSTLMIKRETSVQTAAAFAVQKNSPLKDLISASIINLKSNSQVDSILNRWFFKRRCEEKDNLAHKFSWVYASGLLLVLSSFVALCFVILVCGRLITHSKKNRKD